MSEKDLIEEILNRAGLNISARDQTDAEAREYEASIPPHIRKKVDFIIQTVISNLGNKNMTYSERFSSAITGTSMAAGMISRMSPEDFLIFMAVSINQGKRELGNILAEMIMEQGGDA